MTRRSSITKGVRADASALVWEPTALDTLADAAELMGIAHLQSISMWLDYIEAHPEVRG